MDEPTAGLDPIFRRELLNILHELMQDEDKTIFFSTHITTDLDRIADYITFVHNGEHIFTKEFYKIEEEYAIVKGTLNLLDQETEREFVAIRKSNTGFEALTADKNRVASIFGDSVIMEKPTLEDIMYYTKKKDGNGMVNLILKDVLIQKKLILIYIATIILYLFIDVSLVKIGFLYSMAFITQTFAYDEKDNANILLNSLPYTRKEIVSSKYIGSLVYTSLIIFITSIGDFFLNGKEVLFLWKDILLIIGLVMVTLSFILPIFYKFKTQSLMIAVGALFGIYILIIKFLSPSLNATLRESIQKFMTLQETQMYFVAILTIIILYVGSWLLSIRIYARKVFFKRNSLSPGM